MANYKHLKEKSYTLIKQKILSNEIAPGEHLDLEELSEMVGGSKTPVREAVNMLVQEQLLQNVPGRGVFVTTLSVQSIKEIFQMRRILEPLALQMALDRLNMDMLLSFRDRFTAGIAAKDYPTLHQMDYDFHNYLNDNSGNTYMVQFLRALSDNFQRVRTQPFYMAERTLGGAQEHLVLIDYLLDGNIEQAKPFLVEHISNTEKYFFRSLSSGS